MQQGRAQHGRKNLNCHSLPFLTLKISQTRAGYPPASLFYDSFMTQESARLHDGSSKATGHPVHAPVALI